MDNRHRDTKDSNRDKEREREVILYKKAEKRDIYIRVYQNLATSSENYRTFPKVGPHYKKKACKFLALSDYSLRPNSCVLFEIFVARRKISTAQ